MVIQNGDRSWLWNNIMVIYPHNKHPNLQSRLSSSFHTYKMQSDFTTICKIEDRNVALEEINADGKSFSALGFP